jgi:ectoine hydroxylase-related dioxygenase (phytanoyl-CoA dioxygenase family)
VGFAPHTPTLQSLIDDPPVHPLLQRFLGTKPAFITAWQRVALPHSKGGVWHQDLQREFWPPALNVVIYLDAVTEHNGPTLVVPGTHMLPHPEFDRTVHPKADGCPWAGGQCGRVLRHRVASWSGKHH